MTNSDLSTTYISFSLAMPEVAHKESSQLLKDPMLVLSKKMSKGTMILVLMYNVASYVLRMCYFNLSTRTILAFQLHNAVLN